MSFDSMKIWGAPLVFFPPPTHMVICLFSSLRLSATLVHKQINVSGYERDGAEGSTNGESGQLGALS